MRNEASTKLLSKYSDFLDFFLEKEISILPKITNFNNNVIELEDGKQSPYKPIYSLRLIKRKTLKIYIETHLRTRFIQTSKFSTDAFILFNEKPHGNF